MQCIQILFLHFFWAFLLNIFLWNNGWSVQPRHLFWKAVCSCWTMLVANFEQQAISYYPAGTTPTLQIGEFCILKMPIILHLHKWNGELKMITLFIMIYIPLQGRCIKSHTSVYCTCHKHQIAVTKTSQTSFLTSLDSISVIMLEFLVSLIVIGEHYVNIQLTKFYIFFHVVCCGSQVVVLATNNLPAVFSTTCLFCLSVAVLIVMENN